MPYFCCRADAPQPNPQGTIITIGSVVQAAGSLANAQQALSSVGSAAGSGDILQAVGQAAQAVQVRTRMPRTSFIRHFMRRTVLQVFVSQETPGSCGFILPSSCSSSTHT